MNMMQLAQKLRFDAVLYSAHHSNFVAKLKRQEIEDVINAVLKHYATIADFYEEDAVRVFEEFCKTGQLTLAHN